jgi:hypothetical protein
MILDASLSVLIVGAAAFLLGGSVKGAFGFGLPLVAVPLLATVTAPATAVSLMLFPVLVANIWQAFRGGYYRAALRRFWPFILTLTIAMMMSVQLVATVDPKTVSWMLGFFVVSFAIYQLISPEFTVLHRSEVWLTPLIGFVAGIIGGISGLFGLPLVVYLVTLRLPKDEFVATVSICNLLGALPLFGMLAWHGFLDAEIAAASGGGAMLAWLGVLAGTWSRNRIAQKTFRKILLCLLVAVGLNLFGRGLF